MSLVKTIEIDGQRVPFKASAAIPRIYRIRFQRDIYKDLSELQKAVGKGIVPAPMRSVGNLHQGSGPADHRSRERYVPGKLQRQLRVPGDCRAIRL